MLSVKKGGEMFPTELTYYKINFTLKENFRSSFHPKVGLYVAGLLIYLYHSEQYKDPTVLPFQALCKIQLKLTVKIMETGLFTS